MMRKWPWRKIGRATLAAPVVCLLVLGVEALIAIPGPDDHFHNPSPQPVRLGGPGKPLTYVVLGDSTGAGRGGHYETGIAMQTARHLARFRPIVLVNLAESGAKVHDVQRDQLPAALRLKPDVVLLAVGANDVTHFTSNGSLDAGLSGILKSLASARPGVRVVLTGSPDIGAVRRFAQPLRWVAGLETRRVNRVMDAVIEAAQNRRERVVLAPIAREAGPPFHRDPDLLAPDSFHPNDRGYALWVPVLNAALDKLPPVPSEKPQNAHYP